MAISRTTPFVAAIALGFTLFAGSGEASRPQPVQGVFRGAPTVSWSTGGKGLLLALVAARLLFSQLRNPSA